MKIISALIGVAALGCVALSSGTASAMPVTAPAQASTVTVPAGYICNEWGHCWHRHYYGYGYDHPHYWGGWHRHWGYGWRSHYWHPHYWGGWGWHRHYWHRWYSGN
jgi:hypothetical protein